MNIKKPIFLAVEWLRTVPEKGAYYNEVSNYYN